MNSMSSMDKARRVVMSLLADAQSPTTETIREKVRLVQGMLQIESPGFSVWRPVARAQQSAMQGIHRDPLVAPPRDHSNG